MCGTEVPGTLLEQLLGVTAAQQRQQRALLFARHDALQANVARGTQVAELSTARP
jgi:hypothetical protein